jgi:hypothetical protein
LVKSEAPDLIMETSLEEAPFLRVFRRLLSLSEQSPLRSGHYFGESALCLGGEIKRVAYLGGHQVLDVLGVGNHGGWDGVSRDVFDRSNEVTYS